MKYTDEQRIMKILEHAKYLMQFISEKQINKQMLMDDLITQTQEIIEKEYRRNDA